MCQESASFEFLLYAMTQDGGLDRGSKGQVCATKEFQDRTLLYQNNHNQMMIPYKTLTLTNEVDGQQKQK